MKDVMSKQLIQKFLPVGIGTWGLGMFGETQEAGVSALRAAIDAGFSIIDTAEAYGDGLAESMVGRALQNLHDDYFVITKVLPQNVKNGLLRSSCENSLRRLRRDSIDCYLLHEPGDVPIAQIVEGFQRLKDDGLIRSWGLSNADMYYLAAMEALLPKPRPSCNQILYNLVRRRAELDIIPYCQNKDMAVLAYSPLEQNRPLVRPALADSASVLGASPQQVALAWVISKGAIPIVKASSPAHILANRKAAEIVLPSDVWERLDQDYPLPTRGAPFERYDRVHIAPS